jgi:lipopolysaccharide transport system ATP-binding protein
MTGIRKRYRLGQIGGGTLQGDLQSWWARVRGKEDPNSLIGSRQRSNGETFMALNGIDLTVYQGEALGIIGRNGAGKSTLLKLLSRVTAPTEGSIDIYGRIASMLEVGTGFNGEMTGRENVYLNGAILGMSRAEIDSKMDRIIEFSEVGEFIDTPVKRYSSGMYVKLAFSVAAHLDSEIMIMDEVLAVGDLAFQKKCLDRMKEAASREGRTVLYVSHNMNTIRRLCDRCIVLDEGRIVFDGDVEPAIDMYARTNKNTLTGMDYSGLARPSWLYDQKIRILSAEYEGKENITFERGEVMNMHLVWETLKPVESLSIRFEVLTLEDIPQATFVASGLCSCKKGEIFEIHLALDLSGIAVGSYKTCYTVFEEEVLGHNQDIDWCPGLSFDLVPSEDTKGIDNIWRPQSWGYIRLPDPQLLLLEKRQ